MKDRYRWMLGSLVALATSGAWAGGGRISFTGVILEPTCAAEAMPVDSPNPPPAQVVQAPRRLACGRAASDSGRTYSRTVQSIDAASIANDRLLGYLASYATVGPDGKLETGLIIRTYD